MHEANGRIDEIELKIMTLEKVILNQSPTSLIPTIPAQHGLAQPSLKADDTLQVLMAVETE